MKAAFKLGDAPDDEVPSHFESLINNTIMDRWKLLVAVGGSIDISEYPLECDVLCCVALVIAVEEGFRFDEGQKSRGFDMRVLKALKRMPPFRVPDRIYRINLMLPSVLDLQFTIIIVPVCGDCAIFKFMAVGKASDIGIVQVVSLLSTAINTMKYIQVINNACAKFCNVKELASIIRPLIDGVKKEVFMSKDKIVPTSFMGLPEEVKKHLMKYLKVKDFLALTSSNSNLHNLFAHDDELWRYYLKRDIKISDMSGVNPLQAYKAWHRRGPQDGRRSNLTTVQSQPTSSRPVRSISELSSTSTPTTASQRSQPRSTSSGSEWEF